MYLPAPDESIWVGVLRLALRIPGARTLKDRRRVVSSIKERAYARHRACCADVGHLEAHDRAILAFSVVGNDARMLRSWLDTIRTDVEQSSEALIESQHMETVRIGEHVLRND